MGKRSGLVLDVKQGDVLQIGGARVELVEKSGQIARLRVVAPAQIPVRLSKQPVQQDDKA